MAALQGRIDDASLNSQLRVRQPTPQPERLVVVRVTVTVDRRRHLQNLWPQPPWQPNQSLIIRSKHLPAHKFYVRVTSHRDWHLVCRLQEFATGSTCVPVTRRCQPTELQVLAETDLKKMCTYSERRPGDSEVVRPTPASLSLNRAQLLVPLTIGEAPSLIRREYCPWPGPCGKRIVLDGSSP